MSSSPSALVAERTKKAPSHPVLLGAAVAAELALKVFALSVLVRTSRERVRMGVRWPWALIIVLVNTFGSIAFLLLGRKPAPEGVPTVDELDG